MKYKEYTIANQTVPYRMANQTVPYINAPYIQEG